MPLENVLELDEEILLLRRKGVGTKYPILGLFRLISFHLVGWMTLQ